MIIDATKIDYFSEILNRTDKKASKKVKKAESKNLRANAQSIASKKD